MSSVSACHNQVTSSYVNFVDFLAGTHPSTVVTREQMSAGRSGLHVADTSESVHLSLRAHPSSEESWESSSVELSPLDGLACGT